MTVALLLPQGYQPAPLLFWAVRMASARKQPLAILDAQKSQQNTTNPVGWHDAASASEVVQALREARCHDAYEKGGASEPTDDPQGAGGDSVECRLIEIRHEELEETVLAELRELDASLLILPRHRGVKNTSSEFALQRHLFAHASCATVQLSPGDQDAADCDRILVPTRGSRNTVDAIRLATDLAESEGGIVTALFVQPDVDIAAAEVGRRTIERLVHRYADDTEQRVATESVVCDDVARGILQYAPGQSDLIILGASYHTVVHRLLFSSIAEEVIHAEDRPAVAVIRPASPLGSRAVAACENMLRDVVPQLDRQRRVELVSRVQGSSRWDFDFVALICLSTLIAGLGLIQSSAAVVIGAMLVAPLMTPLLGAGLSLVQGNRLLAVGSLSTVARGFVLALVIGWLLGMCCGLVHPTPEMLARCSPGVSDLLVAFASGLAAAYATGRPNLVSALPGVAIAAALVPPIATSGITLALGRPDLAFGAGLLFLTNIVAIVLGAACSLWTVGIRSVHTHSFVASWSARALAALAIIAVGLGIYEWTSKLKLPLELRSVIAERVSAEEDMRLESVSLVRERGERQLRVVVDAPRPASPELVSNIAELADARLDSEVEIVVETRVVHATAHERQETFAKEEPPATNESAGQAEE